MVFLGMFLSDPNTQKCHFSNQNLYYAPYNYHSGSYSEPVKAAAAHMKGFDRRAIEAAVLV